MKECIYCGDLATDRDHVIPCAYRAAPRHYSNHTVPACADCNRKILRDLPYFTVFQRCEYVAKSLRERLADHLELFEPDDEFTDSIADLALRAEYATNQVKDLCEDEF